MITVDLNDKHLEENLKALMFLRERGLYDDEQLQKMYDEQVEIDRKNEAKESEGSE